MLDNVIFTANAVFPLVILIFLGMLLRNQKKLFANPKDFFNQLEKFVFNVALPVYIFSEIAQAEIDRAFDVGLVLFCVLSIIILCVILIIIMPFFIKDKRARGAFINGICRPNFALLGIPLVEKLTGGAGSAAAALLLAFLVPLFNTMGVVILTLHDADTGGIKENQAKKILKEIVKNPLIRAIILGLPFMLLGFDMPEIMGRSIGYIARTSAPLALISLGAGIELQVLRNKMKLSLTAALIKTVLCPVIFIIPAILMGFRGETLAVIFVMSAAPSAVASYIMAKNMRSDAELAGQILALTTTICPLTIFLGSLALISMGVM